MSEYNSVEHALRKSYQTMNRLIVKTSSINDMRASGAGRDTSGIGLTPQEAHAQAAMIIGLVERTLGETPAMAYVLMQYGRDAAKIDTLIRFVAAGMSTGFQSRRGLEKCIRCYCGQKIGIVPIRTDFRARMENTLEARKDVYARLDSLHQDAIRRLEEAMMAHGLIERAA